MTPEQQARLQSALAALARQVMAHPAVSLVDAAPGEDGRPVLRVHVRDARLAGGQGVFPEAVEGIPVRVVLGDYRPEIGG